MLACSRLAVHCRGRLSRAATRALTVDSDEFRRRMDTVQDNFAEAREEIDAAQESVGTTYFNEEVEAAREVVDDTLRGYRSLLDELDEDERAQVQRSQGMKMEQLKQEFQMLLDAGDA